MTKKCGFIRSVQAPVCYIGHENGFRTEQEFRRHVNQNHGPKMTSVELEDIFKEYEKQKEGWEKLSESEKKVCNGYWKYYGDGMPDKDGKYPDEVLPIIKELSVEKQKQCSKCFFIMSNEQKARTHQKECQASLREVLAQSIMGGNAVRYFRVDGSQTERCENWIDECMKVMRKEEGNSVEVPELIEVGALMSQLRCQDHLVSVGMSVEEAWECVHWCGDEDGVVTGNRMFKMIQMYAKDAMKVNKRNVFVKTHSFLGQRLHLSIGENTLLDYNRKVSSLLYFVVHVYEKKKILSEEQIGLVKELVERDFECDKDGVGMEVLHRLVFNLMLSTDGDDIQSVPLFIACSCVVRDDRESGLYHYGTGNDISHVLAALLHFAQCIVVQEVYGRIYATDSQMDFSLTRAGNKYWGDIEKIEQKRLDCGASYVRFCMDVCNLIRNTEMAHIRFTVCQKHRMCGLLDGKELSLKQIGDGVQHQQEAMGKLYEEKLLVGFEKRLHEGFWEEVAGLMDNVNERAEGYWFGRHPSNQAFMEKWSRLYTEHMIKEGFADDNRMLNITKCTEFVKVSEIAVKKLFWMMHITGGGPARGSELRSVQYRNGRHNIRNIYIQQGRLTFVLMVHKGRDKTGGIGKPIARFPDEETSRILLLYLVFIRPFEDFICWRQSRKQNIETNTRIDAEVWGSDAFLFSSRGKQINEWSTNKAFCKIMHEEFGEEWRFSEYRQYHAGIVKNFVKASGKLEDNNGNQISTSLHEQSGHSIVTANEAYGVSELDMKKLDSVQMDVWRRASRKWHEMINILVLEKSRTEEDMNLGSEKKRSEHEKSADVSFKSRGGGTVGNSETQLKIGDIRRLEGMVAKLLRYVESGGGCGGELIIGRTRGNMNLKRSFDDMAGSDRSTITEDQIVIGLGRAIGKTRAMYRNEHQKKALGAVCNPTGDNIIILPTGSGKSVLFMIQPFIRPGKICVVIVPLVALQLDLVRKCREAGVCGVRWKDRYMAGASIVFCSCEHVTQAEYCSFVKEMSKCGKLLSIFFDEAHLVKQWSEFRPVLTRIKGFIRPDGCDFNIHALTGTCPPEMEPKLVDMLSLRHPQVMRQECVRTNISYNVQSCEEDSLMFWILNVIGKFSVKDETTSCTNRCKRMIIYCLTRAECDIFLGRLEGVCPGGSKLYKYHAGMNRIEREEQRKGWTENDNGNGNEEIIKVMFATAAFGCGIDVEDVGIVIHIGVPRSILSFVQESGRAGRDGRPAKSIVINVVHDKKPKEKGNIRINWDNEETVERDGLEGLGSREEDEELDMNEKSFEAFSCRDGRNEDVEFGSLEGWVSLGSGACRRWLLDAYCDGNKERRTCIDREIISCDLCECKKKISKGMGREINREATVENFRSSIAENVECKEEGRRIERHSGNKKKDVEESVTETPPVSRRLLFHKEETEGSCYGILSQTQSVTAGELMEIVHSIDTLCAICSVKSRKEVAHRNSGKRDTQECKAYHNCCFRCGSRLHRSDSCFTLKFKELSGSCYSCSLSTHAKSLVHEPGTYGTKHCPNKNGIRFMTAVYEDEKLKPIFTQQFPEVAEMSTNEELVCWMKKMDNEGHTWYADVVKWIKETVLSVI